MNPPTFEPLAVYLQTLATSLEVASPPRPARIPVGGTVEHGDETPAASQRAHHELEHASPS